MTSFVKTYIALTRQHASVEEQQLFDEYRGKFIRWGSVGAASGLAFGAALAAIGAFITLCHIETPSASLQRNRLHRVAQLT